MHIRNIHPDPGWREPLCGVQGRGAWRVRGKGCGLGAAAGPQPSIGLRAGARKDAELGCGWRGSRASNRMPLTICCNLSPCGCCLSTLRQRGRPARSAQSSIPGDPAPVPTPKSWTTAPEGRMVRLASGFSCQRTPGLSLRTTENRGLHGA